MKKDTIFTPKSFEPKLFYPKKWVNYNQSEFSTNSVKGPKDENSDKKCQEVTLNSTMCQEMTPKNKKWRQYSLSWQNRVKFCKGFTRDRIFYTNIVCTLVGFCISGKDVNGKKTKYKGEMGGIWKQGYMNRKNVQKGRG